MTLVSLLNQTLVSNWDRSIWFRGVSLVNDTLMVPDPDVAGYIERCYLPKFRPIYPNLTVALIVGQTREPEPERKREPLFKKAYNGSVNQRTTQGDML